MLFSKKAAFDRIWPNAAFLCGGLPVTEFNQLRFSLRPGFASTQPIKTSTENSGISPAKRFLIMLTRIKVLSYMCFSTLQNCNVSVT
ncbi:hypothetical protein C8K15_13515 [Paenisporosarcina sp. OV554]|nr:hypothetical protein C8K15_13515 [Paenisporosarcina sp. OV554]